jgi:hypothetical protein
VEGSSIQSAHAPVPCYRVYWLSPQPLSVSSLPFPPLRGLSAIPLWPKFPRRLFLHGTAPQIPFCPLNGTKLPQGLLPLLVPIAIPTASWGDRKGGKEARWLL